MMSALRKKTVNVRRRSMITRKTTNIVLKKVYITHELIHDYIHYREALFTRTDTEIHQNSTHLKF